MNISEPIIDFTKCCYTFKDFHQGKQCGNNIYVKEFCQYHYDWYEHVDDDMILLESFLGKNKIVFEKCLSFPYHKKTLIRLINGDITDFHHKIPVRATTAASVKDGDISPSTDGSLVPRALISTIGHFYNKLMKTDMTVFKDLVLLRVGPIDLITPKVLSFMLERVFLINCILEMIKDKGIWDVKNQFMPYTITIEHLDSLSIK